MMTHSGGLCWQESTKGMVDKRELQNDKTGWKRPTSSTCIQRGKCQADSIMGEAVILSEKSAAWSTSLKCHYTEACT